MSNAPVHRPPSRTRSWWIPLTAILVMGAVLWSWSHFGVFNPTPFDGDRWNLCAGSDRSGIKLEGGNALLVSEETFPRYQDAAAKGNAMAQYQLGLMRQCGYLLVCDMTEVYKWFSLAAANGNPDALEAKKSVCRGIPLEGVVEGRARVAESGLMPPPAPAAAEYQAEFYRRYPDLRGYKTIVDAVADKPEGKTLSHETECRNF